MPLGMPCNISFVMNPFYSPSSSSFFLSNFSSYPHIISASTQNENAPQEISFLRSILYIILQTEPPFLAQQMPLPTPLLSGKIFRFCHKSVPAVQGSRERMILRKMRNNAVKPIPKDFANELSLSAYYKSMAVSESDNTIDAEYREITDMDALPSGPQEVEMPPAAPPRSEPHR